MLNPGLIGLEMIQYSQRSQGVPAAWLAGNFHIEVGLAGVFGL